MDSVLWEREEEEEEEDIEFVLDTTGDPALQEDFLPFGNKCNYYTDDEDEEGSVSDVQVIGVSRLAFQYLSIWLGGEETTLVPARPVIAVYNTWLVTRRIRFPRLDTHSNIILTLSLSRPQL